MPAPSITCNRCGHAWTATAAAHCAACCHLVGGDRATFSTARLFDLHRSERGDRGTCLDPAKIVKKSGQSAGDRVMFHRDGMWRGPEMTEEQKATIYGVAS